MMLISAMAFIGVTSADSIRVSVTAGVACCFEAVFSQHVSGECHR